MNVLRGSTRLWLGWLLLGGAAGLASLLLGCWHYCLWSRQDLLAYQSVSHHTPVGLALWHGDIGPGKDVERLIHRFPPHQNIRYGPFIELLYLPGGRLKPDTIPLEATRILAKNGQTISASSYGCTFERTYFDLATVEDWAALISRTAESRSRRQN